MSKNSPIFPRFSKSSIPTAATLFVLLVCLMLVGIALWGARNARVVQLHEQEIATENMAHSVAQQADDTFKAADTALIGLSERLATDGTSQLALERLRRLLGWRVAELPALKDLAIYDKNGNIMVNGRDVIHATHNNAAHREYFKFHRSNTYMGPHIDAPMQIRSTKEWVIPLSRRRNGPDGEFAGVVVATIGLDYFYQFYASYDIGRDGLIFLALNNGVQLVRWPMQGRAIGRNMADGPLLSKYASNSESGNATVSSPIDNIERLSSYDHLAHYPLVAVTALSKKEILADWREAVLIQGTIVAVIVVMTALLGFRLIDQITLRLHAEEEARRAGAALLELNQTLEKLALQDGLTGLANRRQFDTVLQNELSRATRSASSLALIMFDVDCFKKYNDIYGHLAGDDCLRQIGKILRSAESRSGDLAARYGGEEFALLLPSTDVQGALKVAENIRNAVRELEITHDGNPPRIVTVSAGVNALVPRDAGDTATTLIGAADEALYAAKSAGRDRCNPAKRA